MRMALCLLILVLGSIAPDVRAEAEEGLPIGREMATDIKAGRQYESGTRVRNASLGISFMIPVDWMGGTPQGSGSQSFLLGSNTKPGVGIVVLLNQVTPKELEEHMNEPQVLEEGFVLQPASSAKISGDRMAASYHAGDNVGLAVAVFGPAQQAIVYLLTGPKDQSAYYWTLLEQLAASTRFTTLDPARLIKQWEELLAGMALKHLEQYSSGEAGGYNRSTVWNLCRDGRFTYTHSSHVTVQVPDGGVSDAGEDRRRGTWRVEAKAADVFLILTEDNGAVTSHAVAYDGEKTYVDSERVYRVESEECA